MTRQKPHSTLEPLPSPPSILPLPGHPHWRPFAVGNGNNPFTEPHRHELCFPCCCCCCHRCWWSCCCCCCCPFAAVSRISNSFVSCTKFITNLFLFNFCHCLVKGTAQPFSLPRDHRFVWAPSLSSLRYAFGSLPPCGAINLPRPHFPLVTQTHIHTLAMKTLLRLFAQFLRYLQVINSSSFSCGSLDLLMNCWQIAANWTV